MGSIALTKEQTELMDILATQWEAGVDAYEPPAGYEEAARSLRGLGLLERPPADAFAAWPARLDLSPYCISAYRPRNYTLPLIADVKRRERWAMHADICQGLEKCDEVLWALSLVSPDRRCRVSVENVIANNQVHMNWLGAVLPPFIRVADTLRAEAYGWAAARKSGAYNGHRPDWKAIAREGLMPLYSFLHEDTMRLLHMA